MLSYIQVEVDEHPQETGRYILTGSRQMDLRAAVSQSLAGRTALLRLLPFSIAELRDAGIILDRDEYLYRGFMPRLYEADLQATPLYRNYFQTYIERDVRITADACNLLKMFGFQERIRGDHPIFTKDNVEEILNLQPMGSKAKPYQTKQIRNLIVRYKLTSVSGTDFSA